jgi:hypothetical protein
MKVPGLLLVLSAIFLSSQFLAVGSACANDPEVLQAQQRLANLGYNPGPLDGVLGPATKRALTVFQQERGLRGTSRIDRQMLDELGKAEVAQRAQEAEGMRSQLRQTGEQVADLQRQLVASQQELARATQAAEALNGQLSAGNERISTLERDLRLAQEAETASEQRVARFLVANVELERKLADTTRALEERNRQIAQIRRELILPMWARPRLPVTDDQAALIAGLVPIQASEQRDSNASGGQPSRVTYSGFDLLRDPGILRTIDQIFLTIVAIFIVIYGNRLLHGILTRIEDDPSNPQNPLRPYSLQVLGLTFILPVLLIISVALKLPSEAITALLGAIIGYIFGSSRTFESRQG